MSDDKTDAINFIEGLRVSKHIYAECPSCQFVFSLYNARLVYGKSPPKDLLSGSEIRVRKTIEEMELLQDKYQVDIENWKTKLQDNKQDWDIKMSMKLEEWSNTESQLKEKLRHLKSDVEATHKEIIEEKVDKALLRQRSVIEGHVAELFPLFKKTRVNPADLCALIPTKPIDFIVFDGLFQKEVRNIIFLDVKKGGSQLSPVQKTIRDTIKDGNVEFKKLRVNFDNVRGTAKEES